MITRCVFCFIILSLFSSQAWSTAIETPIELQQDIEALSIQVLEPEEAAQMLHTEIANNDNQPNHLTLVSSTDDNVTEQIERLTPTNNSSVVEHSKKRLYFKFPFQRIRNRISRHINDQYSFYRSDKAAIVLLTVLTANSSVNWFVFSPDIQASSAAIIVGINTFLYAYLGVNAPNWAQVLRSSKGLLQRSTRFRGLNDKLQDFLSIMSTNALYNLGYHGLIQAVLTWDNISKLFSADIVGLVLQNTVSTVLSSGVWDLVFNEWQEKGIITGSTRKKMSWARSVIMVTLGNLMALGVNEALQGMLAVGATGAMVYLFETNRERLSSLVRRVKSVKNLGSSFSFKRFFRNPFRAAEPRHDPLSSGGQCEMLL